MARICYGLAILAVATIFLGQPRADRFSRRSIPAAMNLFFGVSVGTLAFGHLLAVMTELRSP